MSAARKVWKLPGGVHPPENKQQSLTGPITPAVLPKELIFPLGMHIGAPAEPLVQVGDTVLKGQMIAKPKGFVSTAIHASTSGTVKAIEPRPIVHASGMTANAIVIEPDGHDKWRDRNPLDDYTTLNKNDLLELINNAGIAGMGGAGFPSRVKLATDKTIDELIINGTECEPYITADDILMQEKADEIVEGIKILQYLVNPKETLVGIEDNKPLAIKAMQIATEGTDIQVVVFPTKYPSGGEKQLIQILTGKEVKSGGLPADLGIVCQNIGTVQAIYRAVTFDEPLISRITTLTGKALSEPQNKEVLIGTPFDDVLAAAGFTSKKSERIIAGGPMMGFTVESTAVPVVKTTNCIIAPDKKELPTPPPAQACIRCGMCAEACPASLLPQQLYWFAQAKDQEGLKAHHIMDCIECGACSYVCPSNIPLVQYYRASKGDIRKTEEDAKKADYAKGRYEARLARIEKAEAEKEAKKKARQAKANAAKQSKTDKDAIAAAVARTGKAKTEQASDDPVAAAIARAKAKADGTAPVQSEADKAKDAVASLEKRLKKAQDKLETAKTSNDENLPAFESSVEKLKAKLVEAKAKLPKAAPTATVDTDDPVAAAIAKAQAARSGAGSLSPEEKLDKDIASLEKRIAATGEKVSASEAEGSDKLEILQSSLAKMQEKLDAAKAEKAKLSAPVEPKPEAPAASDDPVQAAIERAKAKREAVIAQSPEERLKNDLASLEKRIKTTTGKLEDAKAAGSDKADILETTLSKLKDKQAKMLEELESL